MTNREEEVNITEESKQFVVFENISKPITGLELQVMRPLLLNLDSQEKNPQHSEKYEVLKRIQLSADSPQQPESTLVVEDSTQDQTEISPLWSMKFDGSCTRTNAGAGV